MLQVPGHLHHGKTLSQNTTSKRECSWTRMDIGLLKLFKFGRSDKHDWMALNPSSSVVLKQGKAYSQNCLCSPCPSIPHAFALAQNWAPGVSILGHPFWQSEPFSFLSFSLSMIPVAITLLGPGSFLCFSLRNSRESMARWQSTCQLSPLSWSTHSLVVFASV